MSSRRSEPNTLRVRSSSFPYLPLSLTFALVLGAAKFAQLRTIATDLGKLATQQWADADDDLQARAQPRKNVDGLADLEAELAQKETDLSCTLQISPAVLQKYEQRKIEVRSSFSEVLEFY